ncbi:MAG TPA: tetraacyldisaccharide 4'-kinase [Anaeromyxobacteraceae bacterium]|nr:tetraacyldisaccharide 4'-kinase [Anaeromyxobacteraceae bacterium]
MNPAARWSGALRRRWWDQAPGAGERLLLAPLAVPEAVFRAGAAARSALYDAGLLRSARATVPVISVGNLAVGGAGKTPVVLSLAERLSRAGRRPAVLSRGYGASIKAPTVVSDGRALLAGSEAGGDEPVLLARRLPTLRVVCGPDRAGLVHLAVELGADVILLDDGFQHRRLSRDLDVVVLDGSNPFGNGHCLPRGPNREPRRALGRAGVVWLTHADRARGEVLERLRAAARRYTGRDPVESRHAPSEVLDAGLNRGFGLASLAGARVGLLTGVARPESVAATVESLGASVVSRSDHPDHHRFSPEDVDAAIGAAFRAGATWLLTTEKDAVRLPTDRASDDRLRVLRIDIELLRGADVVESALSEALAQGGKQRSPRGGI